VIIRRGWIGYSPADVIRTVKAHRSQLAYLDRMHGREIGRLREEQRLAEARIRELERLMEQLTDDGAVLDGTRDDAEKAAHDPVRSSESRR
jgi:uncharacterized protein YbjQ (UPF0145 family)